MGSCVTRGPQPVKEVLSAWRSASVGFFAVKGILLIIHVVASPYGRGAAQDAIRRALPTYHPCYGSAVV